MFDQVGNRKYVIPVLIAIVVACIMGIIFYPMAHMETKGLPFAILSLDEGADTPQGSVNVGETMVENITSAVDAEDGEDSPIVWTVMKSQEELDEALEHNEIYGAVVIPKTFTADQIAVQQQEAQAALAAAQAMQAQAAAAAAAAQSGAAGNATAEDAQALAGSADAAAAGASPDVSASADATAGDAVDSSSVEKPTMSVVINYAKSPMVANLMQSSIVSMFQELGVGVEVEVMNDGGMSSDNASANPLAGMMSQQLSVMPLFMVSAIGALILSRIFQADRTASRAERAKAIGAQVVYAAVLSLIVSLLVYCMLIWVAGMNVPMMEMVLFLWLASFCIMLLVVGAADVSFALGALVVVVVLTCGMATGILPYEMLPAFWQDWVYPWAPQNYIAQGVREVMFLGAGAWNAGSLPLVITAGVGAVLACVAGLLPGKKA